MYKKGYKMKRIQGYYDFLCKVEQSCAKNIETAPTYYTELYESGAKDIVTLMRGEFERRFYNMLIPKKSK